jgi:hypothetical protein
MKQLLAALVLPLALLVPGLALPGLVARRRRSADVA